MSATSPIVLTGVLKSDGTVELERRPEFPTGRVQVTLELLPETSHGTSPLPDAPLIDESIPAPFDLPHGHTIERVHPRLVADRLPDPLEWTDQEGQ